jgi:peptidase inhibitor family I36
VRITTAGRTALGTAAATLLTATAVGAAAAAPSAHRGAAQTPIQAKLDRELLLHPGARQVSDSRVVYTVAGLGEVGVTFSITPMSESQCPANKFCFWDNGNYGGEFRDYPACGSAGVDYWIDGFRDRTTSWKNNTGRTAWMYDYHVLKRTRLWTMNPGVHNPNVGSGANDRADYYRC